MIVEDDAELREGLASLLALEGYDVETAADGREALERLRSGALPPCLILLDLMMPTMSGWEFRREQSRDPALCRVPVIVVTGDANAEQKAQQLAAAAFLSKPYDFDRLMKLVRTYC